ncbi:MAG: BatD family protein [Muribaculaceae bacterium]|nr:BatD family protein [Muribaculaceae bacterium]
MKKLFSILTAFLIFCATMAAQTSFQVIPPRNVIAGNRFAVTYRLSNGEGTSLNAPAISGCKLLNPQPGVSTSQSYQIINGQASSSSTVEYTFIYRAENEGTFTIPAASIVVDGKKLTSQSAKFTVLPADKAPQSQQGGGYGYGYGGSAPQQSVHVDDLASQDDTSRPISKDDIFVRIILNKSHAYEQEAIECTIKLYTKFQRINSFMMTTPPTFDGFLIEEVDTQAALNAVENYNGQNYVTAVLKKCIIFPQKSGKLTINSGKYDLSVVQIERVSNGWFVSGRPVEKEVHLQPYSSSVNITPLPEPRPAGFDNAVGQFTFESRLAPEKLKTGEAASLEYIVTGTGNIKYIHEPKPEIPDDFEQFTPKTDYRTRVSGSTVTGTMMVDYTIVPQSVGTFKIPEQKFVYFDPSKKAYVTLTAPGYNMEIAKGSGTTISAEQREIEARNTDILHIKTGDKQLSKTHEPLIYNWWYWALAGVLVVVLIGATAIYGRQVRLNADVAGRRNARASKVARKRLREAEGFMKTRQPEKFYEAMLKAMWGYLGDKLSMPVSQLTRQNISQTLVGRGVSEDAASRVIGVLDQCEMARYTPDSSSEASVEAVYNEATSSINELEKSNISKRK